MISPVRAAFLAALALLTASAAGAAAIPRGLLDHSLCCGMPPGSVDGGGFFDPASDPVFSRRRQPSPGPAAEKPLPAAAARAAARTAGNTEGIPAVLPASEGTVARGDTVVPPAPESFPPLRMPTEIVAGHLRVDFNVLGGYPFQLSKTDAAAAAAPEAAKTAGVLAQIPELIRQLDGKKVLVSGFMLPMKMEGTLTTEFLLVANSMLCCYGVVPPMNQWMVVQMTKGGVKPQQDVPLAFFGTLRVRPRFDDGALSAIYHLEGDRLHVP